jgi:rubrerythrin
MRSIIGRWILARVVRSALVFEKEAIELYRSMREKAADGQLRHGLEHLLEEEEVHWKILSDAAGGKLDAGQLEKLLHEHLYARLPAIEPLAPGALSRWSAELTEALSREKETFIFYSNLRRMSTIPAVKKAFEVLGDMEREHIEILSRLLGRGET